MGQYQPWTGTTSIARHRKGAKGGGDSLVGLLNYL